MVRNERLKLLATALNNMAVATIITAVIAPVVTLFNGSTGTAVTIWWAFGSAVWILAGLGLHLAAQGVLGRLRP